MLAKITRILLCIALCFVLVSVSSCPDHHGCVDIQDVVGIYTSSSGFDARHFDQVVVKKCERGRCSTISNLVGSKTDSEKFPINIRVEFSLRGTLLKRLDFEEMPKNTVLTFYNGDDCNITTDSMTTDSGEIYRWELEGMFYKDIQSMKDREAIMDTSRSETICWIKEQIDEDDRRCINE